jgi:hypothetical protein
LLNNMKVIANYTNSTCSRVSRSSDSLLPFFLSDDIVMA